MSGDGNEIPQQRVFNAGEAVTMKYMGDLVEMYLRILVTSQKTSCILKVINSLITGFMDQQEIALMARRLTSSKDSIRSMRSLCRVLRLINLALAPLTTPLVMANQSVVLASLLTGCWKLFTQEATSLPVSFKT